MTTEHLIKPQSTSTANVHRIDEKAVTRRRINPYRMFVGSMVPNWLLCRSEINQGAKLAYARLAQFAGKNGECFPKQRTLAAELGVSERMARNYIRELERWGLIESVQNGLTKSNSYFFLHHQWMSDAQPRGSNCSDQGRCSDSGQQEKKGSGQIRQDSSGPIIEENQVNMNQQKRITEGPHYPPEGDSLNGKALNLTQAEQLYEAYPKKVGKPAALRAIRLALTKYPFDFLIERTRLFAQTSNAPVQFIPNPATWFNQERFNDDPATWRRSSVGSEKPQPAIIRPEKFGRGVSRL